MILHHPNELTLAAFAAGTLNEARSLVVATHVAACSECQRLISGLEHIGGVMLDQLPPSEMAEGSKAQLLSRLASEHVAADVAETKSEDAQARILSQYQAGPWRWIGPSVHWRSIGVPSDDGTRVFMLKASAGTKLPAHSHAGTELTCVLSGAFIHQGGRFAAGDCDDADESVEHDPVIDAGEDCVCIVAMQGHIRLKSLIGRLIQPFVRL